MPKAAFVASGSNTQVKTGTGVVYGAVVAGVNGATVFLVDSTSIGATPNYVTQLSNSSNIAVLGPVSANGGSFPLFGLRFSQGLNVSATSNASVTVSFD